MIESQVKENERERERMSALYLKHSCEHFIWNEAFHSLAHIYKPLVSLVLCALLATQILLSSHVKYCEWLSMGYSFIV